MASNHLMSEEDVRQYFLQNNGVVRNTDIVNYFRYYLSDPNIRDEARVLFKTYVNKLSNVKTENGEKFLVLKRQYFHPIDGNGNGLPSIASSSAFSHGPQLLPRQSYSSNPTQLLPPTNSMSYAGHPPSRMVVSSNIDSSHPPPTIHHQPLQRSVSQKSLSQSHLYGSAYSLSSSNSNYTDPYLNYGNPTYLPPPTPSLVGGNSNNNYATNISSSSTGIIGGNGSNYATNIPPPSHYSSNIQVNYNTPVASDYAMDYGLPPPPTQPISPPRRYPTSPPSSSNINSLAASARLPPPYRPPPPAARFSTGSTSGHPPPSPYSSQTNINATSVASRNFPLRFSSPPGHYQSEPATPISPPYQYQRSLSVPGGVTAQQQAENQKYFDSSGSANLPGAAAPPPPVPPRSKRGTSFDRGPKSMSVSMMEDMDESSGHRKMTKGFSRKPPINEDDDDDEGGFLRTERSNSMGGSGKGFPGGELRRSHSEGPGALDNDQAYDSSNKENLGSQHKSASYDMLADGSSGGNNVENGTCLNGNSDEQKISVKERLQKFNRIASESELSAGVSKMPAATRINRRENATKHDSVDYDTASLSSFGFGFAHMQPKDKEWILKASNCDYHALNKMAQENPSLVKRKDMNTALHWAAKHGNAELVKLLAGAYKSDVNNKSNGGYTPLHLAAQFSRQEVYDILVNVYNADKNIRDHSGKKPMQYLVRQDATVSMDTFKKLKEKRRSTENRERDSSFLRIGSLNVRVKKTTEAFGYFLGKSNSASSIERILHKNWGSADNLPESEEKDKDKQLMPPPSGNGVRRVASKANGKRKAKRNPPITDSATATIKENLSDSDSDTACGFGTEWQSGS